MGSTGGGGGQLGQNGQKLHENDKIVILGSKQWGIWREQANFLGSGGNPPPPPLGENLIYHVIFQNQQLAAEDYIVIGEDGIFDTIEVIVL